MRLQLADDVAPALASAHIHSIVAVVLSPLPPALAAEQARALREAAQLTVTFAAGELEVPAGRLTLGERVGSGASSVVHAATLDRFTFALKKCSLAGLSADERRAVVDSARREVRVLRSTVHENIVRLRGIVIDDPDSIGLLMEMAPHGSLRQLLETSPATVVDGGTSVQLRLAAGIASAMAYLHAQTPPVFHHDLKSSNVLLFDGLTPKLTDFGLAVFAGGSTLGSMRSMAAGAGTVAYKAPEQFDDEFSAASEVCSYVPP